MITQGTIDYICRDMLHLDTWRPDFGGPDDNAALVLSECGSLLEVMYVIGAYHYLQQQAAQDSDVCLAPAFGQEIYIETDRARYSALWFMEPWWGFGGYGPSALALIPQYPIGTLRADFAIAYGDDNGSPRWTIGAIVEIDGYAVHRAQRQRDEHRATYIEGTCKVPVLRFFEESHDPLTWFQYVVQHYHDPMSV